MISPELLRRYPFFGFLSELQLEALAMLAEEVEVEQGATLFHNDQPADGLYLLVEGGVDLYYVVTDRDDPRRVKEFFISEISAGEILGISALIEPHIYTSTARASSRSEVVKIEASGLRALCEADAQLSNGLMKATARVAMERLHDTRVQLAAARA
ncbi:MAG: cyclic nucleotide-binding domain-containing protein [Chloroflexi bacterium]|nr:cyclic nucleotide-binding domain-containing protein [Chloroflexota bacterium]